jgi:phage N-6-adenine-methyltransferase
MADVQNSTTPKGATDEWGTEGKIVKTLTKEFDFTLDAAASDDNFKITPYLTKEDDSLSACWEEKAGKGGRVWLNPPYSDTASWINKAYEESKKGLVVVCLVPAMTSDGWWPDATAAEFRFIKGRLKFVNPETGKTMGGYNRPSVLIIFDPSREGEAGTTGSSWITRESLGVGGIYSKKALPRRAHLRPKLSRVVKLGKREHHETKKRKD